MTLDNLDLWGKKKGIKVIGTGDFTHPRWFADIESLLVPAEPRAFQA
jgi:DNA helicase-2/ATP-dependent DNA helicase PcrA